MHAGRLSDPISRMRRSRSSVVVIIIVSSPSSRRQPLHCSAEHRVPARQLAHRHWDCDRTTPRCFRPPPEIESVSLPSSSSLFVEETNLIFHINHLGGRTELDCEEEHFIKGCSLLYFVQYVGGNGNHMRQPPIDCSYMHLVCRQSGIVALVLIYWPL